MLDKKKFMDSLKKAYGDDEIAFEKISLAYDFGKEAHEGQFRMSGEEYFIHPVAVAEILSSFKMDADTIVSGLLHDVIEDTIYTYNDIKERFGENVAKLVDGVTKLGKFKFNSREELEAENLRKMFVAMAEDIRVILIKLSDRLHNIRTLSSMPEEKQTRIAKETLEIYSPIAHRLGIFAMKWELEDISLRYLYPDIYKQILNLINQKRSEREHDIKIVVDMLKTALKPTYKDAEVYGRPKNFYSIYRKMYQQKKDFSEIFDVTAVRIIVDTIEECWGVLGLVHSLWTPVPGRIKDYISTPKLNMYRSIHTTVIGAIDKPFEIQIRTKEMHQEAEYGIAAHWKYKEGTSVKSEEKTLDSKLSWIRQIIENQEDFETPKEFVDTLKFELVSGSVYVCTPQGKVLELPTGSTPVDFAYKIHSDVGDNCIGARVDGRMVPLNYILENGKIVEIITGRSSTGPSRDWLKFVKSSIARNKIKNWFKKQNRDENIEKGKEILEREILRNGFDISLLSNKNLLDEITNKLTLKNLDDLYAAIGYGGIMTSQVIPRIRDFNRREIKKQKRESSDIHTLIENDKLTKTAGRDNKSGAIFIEGIGETSYKIAKCCNPLPGDAITGFINRGDGITVHQTSCKVLKKTIEDDDRVISVSWTYTNEATYNCEIQIIAFDQKGLLSDLSVMMAESNVLVNSVNAKKTPDSKAIIRLNIAITDKAHLNKVINKLSKMPATLSVERVSPN